LSKRRLEKSFDLIFKSIKESRLYYISYEIRIIIINDYDKIIEEEYFND
jgi:hypothetical protein